MRIISFIEKEQETVIEKILRHCGLWMVTESCRGKVAPPRPPPEPEHPDTFEEPELDYGFFDRTVFCVALSRVEGILVTAFTSDYDQPPIAPRNAPSRLLCLFSCFSILFWVFFLQWRIDRSTEAA